MLFFLIFPDFVSKTEKKIKSKKGKKTAYQRSRVFRYDSKMWKSCRDKTLGSLLEELQRCREVTAGMLPQRQSVSISSHPYTVCPMKCTSCHGSKNTVWELWRSGLEAPTQSGFDAACSHVIQRDCAPRWMFPESRATDAVFLKTPNIKILST